ncbi:3-hydroxyacyl-CoA dehydrogenase NAD-binding domain-containing protein [Hyphobacterium sp. WM6]
MSYEQHDGIAIVTVDNGPVNALSHAVRLGLQSAFQRFETDDTARIALIVGAGRFFIGGADISEFGKPRSEPALPGIINSIEFGEKPVVAAIHGAALGGGLEVALGAHYRLALKGAQLGLPETKLGLIPGAGGSQRVPRLIGIAAALEMIPTGRVMPAEEALKLGLVDRVVDASDVREAGIAYATELLDKGAPPKPVGALPSPQNDPKAFEAARSGLAKSARGEVAPVAAVDAIELATRLDIHEGMAEERRIFHKMMDTPQRAALIHAFFSERKVTKLPALEAVAPREIATAGVIGGGTMGAGIATAALLRGLPITLLERDADAANAARERIAGNLDAAVKRGKLAHEGRERILQEHLAVVTDYDALSSCDLIIEAVFEDMAVKKQVFAELDRVAKPNAILATNTSYLNVNEIADSVSRPGDVIGLHFFSPAHVMKLLEVVVADKTLPEVTATSFALAKRLGKVAVRAGVCDGFIGNRILAHYRKVLDQAVLAGASPFDVDRALTGYGLAMGPYAVGDLAGLDIGWAHRKRLAATRDPRETYAEFSDRLCEAGHFGRKTGRGFYDYSTGKPVPNEDVLDILERERASKGITARTLSDDDIVRRYRAAMVNESARIIDEGIARRPLDVDVTMLNGYGFPRWRGGPMHDADAVGLESILTDIKTFAAEDDFLWQPASLLERLVAEGRTFASLND